VASAAGLHGQPNMAVYGASKAFDIMLAEALWGELGGRGVDVLTLVLGATDTPEFRRILHERGVIPSVDEPIPFPDVTSSDEAASDAIEYLGKGPTRLVGERTRERLGVFATMTRNDVVATLVQSAGGIMRNDESG
jgi:short-subunit dehydrogenase